MQKTNDASKETLPRFEQEQVAQAKKIMQPFVLRRLKKDVLKDLPEKTEKLIYCEMIEKQHLKYTDLISTFSKRAERKEVVIKCFKSRFDFASYSAKIFSSYIPILIFS